MRSMRVAPRRSIDVTFVPTRKFFPMDVTFGNIAPTATWPVRRVQSVMKDWPTVTTCDHGGDMMVVVVVAKGITVGAVGGAAATPLGSTAAAVALTVVVVAPSSFSSTSAA